jgi:hypothetical protein
VLTLAASSVQVGYLSAVIQLPYLLIWLFIGVVVDRVRRRNLLVGADLGRAAVLGVIPALYWLHELGLVWLYAAGRRRPAASPPALRQALAVIDHHVDDYIARARLKARGLKT